MKRAEIRGCTTKKRKKEKKSARKEKNFGYIFLGPRKKFLLSRIKGLIILFAPE